ncbi:MAG: sulfotransferase [Thermomicrobiales bacterium]
MTLVTSLAVTLADELDPQRIRSIGIESPESGDTSAAWGIRVSGHVLGASSPVDRVEAAVTGHVLAHQQPHLPTPDVAMRHPGTPGSDACGFSLLADTASLRENFTITIRAVLADGPVVPFATVTGIRRAIASGYQPRLRPLLLNSFGRTGTTLLMRLLSAHPGVICYDLPPYEIRGGKYWTHLLRVLGAPADNSRQIGSPMDFQSELYAASGNPFYASDFAASSGVESWSGSRYVEQLAAFCQRSTDGWYGAVATAQGKDPAPLVYFAEKHFPDVYPRLIRSVYPQAHELFLVRDFRDMISSMLAYNARKGMGDFGRLRVASDEAWLDFMHELFVIMLAAYRERGEPGSLIHYEALISDPAAVLVPLLTRLGLDASPPTLAAMLAVIDAPELRGHGSSASAEASVGRWRRDLTPEMQAMIEAKFGDLLEAFGYSTGPSRN